MRDIFSIDSPVMRFLSFLADLMLLNLLFLVSCIPIITIGASVTALSRVALNMKRGTYSVWSDYLKSFRQGFKQATILFFLLLLIVLALAADLYLLSLLQSSNRAAFMVPFFALLLMTMFTACHLFPLVGQFQNTNKRAIFNAMYLSIRYLPRTILMLLLDFAPLVAFVFAPQFFVQFGYLWVLIYFALSAYCKASLLSGVFLKIMRKEDRAAQEALLEESPVS